MTERKFLPPLIELIDRLSVDQIKEVLLSSGKEVICEEMNLLHHDIDLLIKERNIGLSAHLIAIIIAIAQINVHIWNLKDRMSGNSGDYHEQLKLAHQLNGIRNQLKNIMMVELADVAPGSKRTNFNTDGLTGWDMHVLSMK